MSLHDAVLAGNIAQIDAIMAATPGEIDGLSALLAERLKKIYFLDLFVDESNFPTLQGWLHLTNHHNLSVKDSPSEQLAIQLYGQMLIVDYELSKPLIQEAITHPIPNFSKNNFPLMLAGTLSSFFASKPNLTAEDRTWVDGLIDSVISAAPERFKTIQTKESMLANLFSIAVLIAPNTPESGASLRKTLTNKLDPIVEEKTRKYFLSSIAANFSQHIPNEEVPRSCHKLAQLLRHPDAEKLFAASTKCLILSACTPATARGAA